MQNCLYVCVYVAKDDFHFRMPVDEDDPRRLMTLRFFRTKLQIGVFREIKASKKCNATAQMPECFIYSSSYFILFFNMAMNLF